MSTADPSRTAVLFDIDGTLIDSTYHHALAWHRALLDHDAVVPMTRIHRAIGMGGDKIVAHLGGDDLEAEHGDALRDRWRAEYAAIRHQVRPVPGAREAVVNAHDLGYRVALASSGDPEFSREARDLLDLADHIEVLTTAADVEDSKPEPDLLGTTLERLGGVDHAVMVGDTIWDVEAARRTGVPCVAVTSGGISRGELQSAAAARVVDSLDGLDWSGVVGPIRGGTD